MRVLVVGGGSAGHVLPARPVMQHYLDQGDEVIFVGTRSGLEESLVEDLQVSFHGISAGKLRRYLSWQNLIDTMRVALGVVESIILLARVRPNVVFSKGGFVSFPVVLAAWLWRVPVVAHESDFSPGLANRLVRPFVKTFCVSFKETEVAGHSRVVHSGTPIRSEILKGDAEAGRKLLGVDEAKPLLVITGGSLGADALNTIVRASLDVLLEEYYVVHVVGKGKSTSLDKLGYLQFEYVGEGWGDILAAADRVISRAGANALFELFALRKLCLLVPLSQVASRGDQLENAVFAAQEGLAVVIEEDALDAESLAESLEVLVNKESEIRARLQAFVLPDAAATIVSEIDALGA
jgi:UDP-N-acetylglucosamine--N-acetylmuramyl-(pentapeptide) pyrophosphoryl-undecaprenol N-acetylglucosamine transferase